MLYIQALYVIIIQVFNYYYQSKDIYDPIKLICNNLKFYRTHKFNAYDFWALLSSYLGPSAGW